MKIVINPIELSKAVEEKVVRGRSRKYYRFRGGRWYGGIATADTVGCNLSCGFCWSWRANHRIDGVGEFYTPEQVASKLVNIAYRRGYRLIRLSGGEPTLGFQHLVEVLNNLEYENLGFILETNGILIGYERGYARTLSKFKFIHVRVSIKGTNPEEFSKLTLAEPWGFDLQLKALENLLDEGVPCHPAVMLSFSAKEDIDDLKSKLEEIDRRLVEDFEEEYVFLYPHVEEILRRRKLKPIVAYRPNSIPSELI